MKQITLSRFVPSILAALTGLVLSGPACPAQQPQSPIRPAEPLPQSNSAQGAASTPILPNRPPPPPAVPPVTLVQPTITPMAPPPDRRMEAVAYAKLQRAGRVMFLREFHTGEGRYSF